MPSSFLSDDAALAEFMRKNPRIPNQPRVVKFRTGRYERLWVDNVVAIGNSVGFVEPLEATALQVLCVEASTLADSLVDSLCSPTPTLVELYNQFNTRAWDDIRDFLAMLIGQAVPHDKPFSPSAQEAKQRKARCNTWELEARRGLDVKQCLEATRRPGVKW